LSEAGLLSATAISASATSASVTYAQTVVTSSPYVTAGVVQSTQATAGVWATQPTIVPKDANLSSLVFGLGFSSVVNVIASNVTATIYFNLKPIPKLVYISVTTSSSQFLQLITPSGTVFSIYQFTNNALVEPALLVVPPGFGYRVTGGTVLTWLEG